MIRVTPGRYGAVAPSGEEWPLNRNRYLEYQVNTIYSTVQGEGGLAGTPMTIVRLQGCPIACSFCDTPETWAHEGTWMTARKIAEVVSAHSPRWTLVTGGEPCWHDLGALTGALKASALRRAIETSGAYPITGQWDWVCISPKPAGRLPLDPLNLRTAHEIKWIIGRERDVEELETFLARHASALKRPSVIEGRKGEARISVQPMSCARKPTEIALDALEKHPEWFLSLQTHKMIGIP